MQTFVPYGDVFDANASVLDVRRLGKQRVEGLQILQANDAWRRGVKSGWQNHPAAKMWRCHDAALIMYTLEMCYHWVALGYKDSIAEQLRNRYPESCKLIDEHPDAVAMPLWLYDQRVTESHRSNLLRKAPEHYRQYWPELSDNLPYHWPA